MEIKGTMTAGAYLSGELCLSHTHANKKILDGITVEKTAEWDGKADESTVIRLWQPNTEYKAGDLVFYKPSDSNVLSLYMIDSNHTSGNEFNAELCTYLIHSDAQTAQTAKYAGFDMDDNNIIDTYAKKSDLSSYSKNPTLINDGSTTYNLEFLGSINKIIRLSTLNELNFTFNDGEYNADLLINLVFTSGETPTQISYPNTGILNWIGTDCALSEGQSIFAPSANTRYDIVFSFDGSQLVGYVCGYTPATVSNG